MMRSRTNLLRFLIGSHLLFLLGCLLTNAGPYIELLHIGVISINGGGFAVFLPILYTFVATDDLREEDVLPFCILFFQAGSAGNSIWSLARRYWSTGPTVSSDWVSLVLFWTMLAGMFALLATKIDHGRLPKLAAYYLGRRIAAVTALVIFSMFGLKWYYLGTFF